MASNENSDLMQFAKEYAKAEKELGVEPWVFLAIERFEKGKREPTRLFTYDFPREVYKRREWVPEWRRCWFVCRYPKSSIRVYTSYYDKRLGKSMKLNDDLRTLAACKANVTKQKRIIRDYIKHRKENDLFFVEEEDETLIKAKKKLAEKITQLEAATERMKLKIEQIKKEQNEIHRKER